MGELQDLGSSKLEVLDSELFRAETSVNLQVFDFVCEESLASVQDLELSNAKTHGEIELFSA